MICSHETPSFAWRSTKAICASENLDRFIGLSPDEPTASEVENSSFRRSNFRGAGHEVVCLGTPEPFTAIGVHYIDFHQISDGEVIALLPEHLTEEAGRRDAKAGH